MLILSSLTYRVGISCEMGTKWVEMGTNGSVKWVENGYLKCVSEPMTLCLCPMADSMLLRRV